MTRSSATALVRVVALELPAQALGETVTVEVAETWEQAPLDGARQILLGVAAAAAAADLRGRCLAIWLGASSSAPRRRWPRSPPGSTSRAAATAAWREGPGRAADARWSAIRLFGGVPGGRSPWALLGCCCCASRSTYLFSLLFLSAVIASAWLGGKVLGWIAAILCTLAVEYFFMRPYYSLGVTYQEAPYFVAFMVSTMIAGNWFGIWRKNMDLTLRRARDELESRIQAGGMELENFTAAALRRQRRAPAAHAADFAQAEHGAGDEGSGNEELAAAAAGSLRWRRIG